MRRVAIDQINTKCRFGTCKGKYTQSDVVGSLRCSVCGDTIKRYKVEIKKDNGKKI